MASKNPPELSLFGHKILDLLQSLTSEWSTIDYSKLTDTEAKALDRLTEAGCVEQLWKIKARMSGFAHRLHLCCRVSGAFRPLLRGTVLTAVPDWVTSDGRTKGRWHMRFMPVISARLTCRGEQDKQDIETDGPADFLEHLEPTTYLHPRAIAQGTIVVESHHVKMAGKLEPQSPLADQTTQPSASTLTQPETGERNGGSGLKSLPLTSDTDRTLKELQVTTADIDGDGRKERAEAASDANQWFRDAPPKDSKFTSGPLEGSLKNLAKWIKIDPRTLAKHNGKSVCWIQKIHCRMFAVWFSSQQKFAEANQRRLAENGDHTK